MKHQLWSSLTAALVFGALGQISASHAETSQLENQSNEVLSPQLENTTTQPVSNQAVAAPENSAPQFAPTPSKPTVAKTYAHIVAGRQAATVYLRNIPVLTFLATVDASPTISTGRPTKRPIVYAPAPQTESLNQEKVLKPNSATTDDPITRANDIANRLNELNPNSIENISVTPQAGDSYLIKINNQALVVINESTILPDTTLNRAEDALQATNRLRRLLADAPPLTEIPGMARPVAANSYPVNPVTNQETTSYSNAPVVYRVSGWASWYGPGFDGNLSASGEVFNQNDMTAAHLELPFGTLVRVTNLDNGRTVIVRINDRGPYIEDRILDLSAGAAEVLGMMGSGVAPISLEVLGNQSAQNISR